MKYFNIVLLLALMCACNSGKTQKTSFPENGENQIVENNVAEVITPTKESAIRKIKTIYSIIFGEYKNAKRVNWPFSIFFDDELSSLWNTIPEGSGIGYDPWICSQDHDENALELLEVKVKEIVGNKDDGYSTEAIVTLKLFEIGEPHKICLLLSTNKKGNDSYDWYVHDFIDLQDPEDEGVIALIKNEFSNSVH